MTYVTSIVHLSILIREVLLCAVHVDQQIDSQLDQVLKNKEPQDSQASVAAPQGSGIIVEELVERVQEPGTVMTPRKVSSGHSREDAHMNLILRACKPSQMKFLPLKAESLFSWGFAMQIFCLGFVHFNIRPRNLHNTWNVKNLGEMTRNIPAL